MLISIRSLLQLLLFAFAASKTPDIQKQILWFACNEAQKGKYYSHTQLTQEKEKAKKKTEYKTGETTMLMASECKNERKGHALKAKQHIK